MEIQFSPQTAKNAAGAKGKLYVLQKRKAPDFRRGHR